MRGRRMAVDDSHKKKDPKYDHKDGCVTDTRRLVPLPPSSLLP